MVQVSFLSTWNLWQFSGLPPAPDEDVAVRVPCDDVTGEAEGQARDVLGLISLIEKAGLARQGQAEMERKIL